MTRPEPLTEGSVLGIPSPASPISAERMEKGCEMLHRLGFKTKLAPHALERNGYYAGDDATRAADLMAVFEDREADGIICSMGGFGCERLFRHLDFDVMRRNPKVFIGYSNITALHLMIHRFAPMPTVYFYGVGGIEFGSREHDLSLPLETLVRLVREPECNLDLPIHNGDTPVETLVGGRVTAPVIGGAALSNAMGTPYEIDCRGKILAVELGLLGLWWGINLAQLQNAGKLDDAVGFIIPAVEDMDMPLWENTPLQAPSGEMQSKLDFLNEFIAPLNKPTLYNVPYGHSHRPLPVPFGTMAELDADERRITLCEGVVSG